MQDLGYCACGTWDGVREGGRLLCRGVLVLVYLMDFEICQVLPDPNANPSSTVDDSSVSFRVQFEKLDCLCTMDD